MRTSMEKKLQSCGFWWYQYTYRLKNVIYLFTKKEQERLRNNAFIEAQTSVDSSNAPCLTLKTLCRHFVLDDLKLTLCILN